MLKLINKKTRLTMFSKLPKYEIFFAPSPINRGSCNGCISAEFWKCPSHNEISKLPINFDISMPEQGYIYII